MRHELYGESVFTSFRTNSSIVFGFQQHIDRLYNAVVRTYGLDHLSLEQFKKYFLQQFDFATLCKENPNHYFRISFYTKGKLSLATAHFSQEDIAVKITINDLASTQEKSLKLKIFESPYSRHYVPIKSGSYFQSLHFKKQAIRDGFDDVLFTSQQEVTEASSSNIIFERDGEFFTPQGDFFLRGVTLALFAEYCDQRKVLFEEKIINQDGLTQYDHVYLLNSVKGLIPVEVINNKRYAINDKLKQNFFYFCQEKYGS